ncbi:MAG: hypothetical protein ACJA1A_000673 [Saprospiraceae bacterium]|jgi:hypothetical protein
MTKWKYKISALLLLLLFGSGIVRANSLSKKQLIKEIHQSFDVDSDAILGVHNRYGNIKITTWNKNTVDVDVLIKVKTASKSKGQTFLEDISIDFSHSRSKVGMKTVYPDQENSSWWSSWWSNSNNIDFEVHYTIKVPKGISTNLVNKYGSISQASIGGSSDVTNKFGDIFFDNVGGNLTLNLGYGKANVSKVKNVIVEIKNSTLTIATCDDIKMTSKYSNFSFGSCGNMDLDTKYDEFTIESAREIVNNGKYDNFKIGEAESLILETKNTSVSVKKLNRKCKVKTKYGSIHVRSTGPNLELISLESKYTEYKFGVDSDFHLKFLGDYSGLSIGVSHEKYHSEKDGSEINVKAFRGTKNAKLKISADLKYGGLKITENK